MSNKQTWKMVRIREATHIRLCDFIQTLRRACENGQYEAKNRHLLDISLDDAIVALLDRQDNHKKRSRRSAEKRKRATVDNVDTNPVTEG